jgi:hypothetical protein
MGMHTGTLVLLGNNNGIVFLEINLPANSPSANGPEPLSQALLEGVQDCPTSAVLACPERPLRSDCLLFDVGLFIERLSIGRYVALLVSCRRLHRLSRKSYLSTIKQFSYDSD